jgi:hypothetical protein
MFNQEPDTHSGKVALVAAVGSIGTMAGTIATSTHDQPVLTAFLAILSGVCSLIAALSNKPGAPK